jgi:hypothetical protein
MADKEDTLFYAGYGFAGIMLGVLGMLVAINFIEAWIAFGLWLLSLSLILIGLGLVRTESAPSGSSALMGVGLFFAVISVVVLGIILQLFNPAFALGLLILLFSIGLLGLGIKRTRATS